MDTLCSPVTNVLLPIFNRSIQEQLLLSFDSGVVMLDVANKSIKDIPQTYQWNSSREYIWDISILVAQARGSLRTTNKIMMRLGKIFKGSAFINFKMIQIGLQSNIP